MQSKLISGRLVAVIVEDPETGARAKVVGPVEIVEESGGIVQVISVRGRAKALGPDGS